MHLKEHGEKSSVSWEFWATANSSSKYFDFERNPNFQEAENEKPAD